MSRRRMSAGPSIDLFPFLSVLVCIIGVITLQIIGMSLSTEGDDASSCGLQVCCGAESYYVETGESAAWRDAGSPGSAFQEALGKIGTEHWTHVALLVTPRGFSCFYRLRSIAADLRVLLGYGAADTCPSWAGERE